MSEAATAQSSAPRCMGCGKPVTGGKTFLILTGTSSDDGEFSERGQEGRLHEECYYRTVRSPKSALMELRRIARSDSAKSNGASKPKGRGRLRKVQ